MIEVDKIRDSEPEAAGTAPRPLSGVRVLDLTRVIAGPVAGRTLAAHGADVMRVTGSHLPGFPESLDVDMGHGKLSAAIDLRNEEGRARLDNLIENADVFLQAYRPGSLAQRGYSPEELIARRPGLIYATLSAYGHTGPWRDRRGFDSLAQSVSGIVHEESGDGPPHHLPAQALDYVSGYLLAFGIMTALKRRAQEGGSYLVRTSLAQTGRWIQSLGRTPASELPGALDLSFDGVPDLLTQRDTAFGRLTFLGPIGQMPETPPHWERPSVPLGSSEPHWPER
ncbi:MAG TPA: CoA transferase [Dehalococcoidia bacterium]|nr:CoA transferase [Dehalococcoidia bacterium]